MATIIFGSPAYAKSGNYSAPGNSDLTGMENRLVKLVAGSYANTEMQALRNVTNVETLALAGSPPIVTLKFMVIAGIHPLVTIGGNTYGWVSGSPSGLQYTINESTSVLTFPSGTTGTAEVAYTTYGVALSYLPLVSPAVTLSGDGSTTFSAFALDTTGFPASGHYKVDYNSGVIGFDSATASGTPTINYTASFALCDLSGAGELAQFVVSIGAAAGVLSVLKPLLYGGDCIAIAGEALSPGVLVMSDASGKVITATAGHWAVGVTETSAASGRQILIRPVISFLPSNYNTTPGTQLIDI